MNFYYVTEYKGLFVIGTLPALFSCVRTLVILGITISFEIER